MRRLAYGRSHANGYTGMRSNSRAMPKKHVRITHSPSSTLIVEGPLGWGITPLEGNYYISRKYLQTDAFKPNFVPGICCYKFLYVWLDLRLPEGGKSKSLGWMYWLPNPVFPFIWYRVAVPGFHPELLIEEFEMIPVAA